MEALRERIKSQGQHNANFTLGGGDVQIASRDVYSTQVDQSESDSSEDDTSRKVYTLRVVNTDAEVIPFKCAVSHDCELDLYIEETPFEVDFVAQRIIVLLDTINSNAELDVSLVAEVNDEQRKMSGFRGSSGVIFHDPRSLHSGNQSGRF